MYDDDVCLFFDCELLKFCDFVSDSVDVDLYDCELVAGGGVLCCWGVSEGLVCCCFVRGFFGVVGGWSYVRWGLVLCAGPCVRVLFEGGSAAF